MADQTRGVARLKMVLLMNILRSMMSTRIQMEPKFWESALSAAEVRKTSGGAIPDRWDIFCLKNFNEWDEEILNVRIEMHYYHRLWCCQTGVVLTPYRISLLKGLCLVSTSCFEAR